MSRKSLVFILAGIVFLFPSFCFGGSTINVKADGTGDYPTIQAAINAAADEGDIVQVEDGTYTGVGNRDIDFLGKAITVRGNVEDPNLVVIDCQGTFEDNHRGFVFISGEDPNSILEGFKITNGHERSGAGIYINISSPLINKCIIISCSAEFSGGVIYCRGTNNPTIENCIVSDNNGSGFDGCDGTIINCTVSGNTAYYGGGGFNSCDGTITDCTVSGNTASNYGGGFFVCNGVITNCMVRGNIAGYYTFACGGGFYGCDGTITNCTIISNTANYDGGGFSFCDGTITDCTISGNTAYRFGSGFDSCNAAITNCTVSGNFGTGGFSGCNGTISNCMVNENSGTAFYICDGIVINCTVSDNSGTGLSGCDGTIINCRVSDNSGTGLSGCNGIITNCTISGNTATAGGGFRGCNGTIINCTVSGNTAHLGGGFYECNADINNNIVWGNININPAAGLEQIYASSTPSYSCIEGWTGGGVGNISDDPLFVNAANDDYHLLFGSACINSGDPNYIENPDETDIDGDRRLVGRIDIGADEFFAKGAPAIYVIDKDINFVEGGIGSNAEPKTIGLCNIGELDSDWSIVNNCDWLTVTPAFGVTGSLQTDEVAVGIDNNYIVYGLQTCQFQVFDPCSVTGPEIVTVTLDVLRPEIDLSPFSFDFECDVDEPNVLTQVLSISNSGHGTLNWQLSEDCDWLDVDKVSGQCMDGSDDVVLTVNTDGLGIGLHDCSLKIIDENAVRQMRMVHVSLHVYRDGERHVPLEYPNISAAFIAAVDGDHVIIHPGRWRYGGHTEIPDKRLTIRCVDPNDPGYVQSTILESGIYTKPGLRLNPLAIEGLSFIYSAATFNQSFVNSGIYFWDTKAAVRNCKFNGWPQGGLAISGMGSDVLIENCLFSGNGIAGIWVMIRSTATVNVNQCTIVASQEAVSDSWPIVFGSMAGIRIDGYNNNQLHVRNSILDNVVSEDDAEIIFGSMSSHEMNYASVSNCCIPAGPGSIKIADPNYVDFTWGAGNIEVDPLFVREPNDGGDGWFDVPGNGVDESANNDYGDLHLKSTVGRYVFDEFAETDFNFDKQVDLGDFAMIAKVWGGHYCLPTEFLAKYDLNENFDIDLPDLVLFSYDYLEPRVFGDWVADGVTSPCIDAGDAGDAGWENELWPHGGRINMGAYGGTAQASMSLDMVGNTADLNHDGVVDMSDWALFADDWMSERVLLDSDLDRDSDVDVVDVGMFGENWLIGIN